MGVLSEELAKVIHRKRRGGRFTQAELGNRIGVSGSYISGLENGKSSPRVVELEEMAAQFRTTAFEMIQEAMRNAERFVPVSETVGEGLDAIAADLSLEQRRMAREFLLFLRERAKEQERATADEDPR